MLPSSLALALAVVPAQVTTEHWSLRPPVRPPLPAVQDEAWAEHPVDRFVLARLEAEALTPSPEAPRTTLIRRVTLDLTGLPPTPEEVAAFVADPRPDAWERVVDRLLASPHYGERMAQGWLDLARYADTNGYDADSPRQMSAWRDYVIAAFQSDMPFAQFTLEQVAGDLLPGATLSQRVATGFLRNHPVADVSLGLPGEYRHKYVADRTATFATTWLGLTVGCAECHDHKFDPLSQRDYYGLYAFFDRLEEPGVALDGPDTPKPRLALPTAEQGSRLLTLQARRDTLQTRLEVRRREVTAAFSAWRAGLAAQPAAPAPIAAFELEADTEAAAVAGIGQVTFEPAVRGLGARLDGKSGFLRARAELELRADQAFTLSAWVRPESGDARPAGALIGKVDTAADGRGYSLVLVGGKPTVELTGGEQDTLSAEARDPLPLDRWSHVLATYDGSRLASGLRLFVDGVPVARAEATPRKLGEGPAKPLAGELTNTSDLRLGGLDFASLAGGLDAVRIHAGALTEEDTRQLVLTDLAHAAGERPESAALLLDWFLAYEDKAGRELTRSLATLEHEHRELLAEVALVSVMEDCQGTPPTRLLSRGDFTQPREVVAPALPAVLGTLPAGATRDRLGLAQWLVRPENPLVGRVAVNRLWRQCFGRGLVATLDDFGTRGEAPSHPELLDWLSREFTDNGGSHKRLLRLLVTSRTYRQASGVCTERWQRDPDNRLFARGGRWRFDAEALRDQALLVGGLIDLRVGGPSVRPWQPEDLWRVVSPDADRARRGLYVEVNRKTPFTSFALFDAPPRDVCTAERQVTTTPLQALALLNDTNFHAAARGLAEQLLADAAGAPRRDDTARLALGFVRCTARTPSEDELRLLRAFITEQRGRCAADELTVWTAACAVLLNLAETLTRT